MNTPPATPLERRITNLEVNHARVEERLTMGAATLADIRQSIKPVPFYSWLLPLLSLALAGYMTLGDRQERASKAEVETLRATVQDLEVRQARTEQLLQEVDRGIRRVEESQKALTDLVGQALRRRK